MAETEDIGSAAARLTRARRIVVKLGSALLVGPDGAPAAGRFAGLAADIAEFRRRGSEIILVSSGAIALGRRRLGLGPSARLAEKQAAAAAGQTLLMQAWQTALAPHGLAAGQLLLTLDDTENRRRYLNARATVEALLTLNAIPVINENDTVATAEIRYGDNDRLSAHAAQMTGADVLVMLSDIDGLYTADPRKTGTARHISAVAVITSDIEAMAGGANSVTGVGSGGMATKVSAAKIAVSAGCAAIIGQGDVDRPLSAILGGANATLFMPVSTPERARLAWIGGRLRPAGALHVDAGAAAALAAGKSLLSAGIVRADGDFRRGDAVSVIDPSGAVLGQGLSAYDADEVRRLAGRKSQEIEEILGYAGPNAVIHRDDLAIAGRGADKRT
ncbi:MAG: glutamate 5-kinase [Pseudomonadota bacterium]|nr:glutamate 5-kinase [Pseudomonadota bacterium]